MRWFRRMKRRAQCRRRHGDACPHVENHSRQGARWAPPISVDQKQTAFPAWHVASEAARGVGARTNDEIVPMVFIPEARTEGVPSFPEWEAQPGSATRGAAARSHRAAN